MKETLDHHSSFNEFDNDDNENNDSNENNHNHNHNHNHNTGGAGGKKPAAMHIIHRKQ